MDTHMISREFAWYMINSGDILGIYESLFSLIHGFISEKCMIFVSLIANLRDVHVFRAFISLEVGKGEVYEWMKAAEHLLRRK